MRRALPVVLVLLAALLVWLAFRGAHPVPERRPGGDDAPADLGDGSEAAASADRRRTRAPGPQDAAETAGPASEFLRGHPEIGQDREQDPALGRIAGRVLLAPDVPAPEAVVETSVRGIVNARVHVRDGDFALRNVPPGAGIALTARAPGHAPGGLDKLVLEAGATLEVGAVYVGPAMDAGVANALEAVVTGTGGTPVEGAQVTATTGFYGATLALAELEKQPGAALLRAITGPDGRARFEPLPPGSYDVFVEAEGYGFSVRQRFLVQRDTRAELDFRLVPGLEISGRVLDEAGEPVAKATVMGLRWGSFENFPPTFTDDTGAFRLQGLSAGNYFLVAYAADTRHGARELQNVAAGTRDLEIRLAAGAELAVRVTDAATSEVVTRFGLRPFRTVPFAYLFSPHVEATAGEDGVFRMPLPGGDYGLEVTARGYALATVQSFRVPTSAPVEVRLEPAGVVHGRVVSRDGGRPIAGAQVFVKRGGFPPTRVKDQQTVTDRDGRFVLDGLPRRPMSLWIGHVDHDEAAFEGVEPAARGEDGALPPPREFALGSGGRVEGRVLGPDRTPLAGATMQLSAGFDTSALRNTVVDANGAYAFRNVPAGRYTVSIGGLLSDRGGGSRSDVEVREGAVTVVDFGTEAEGQTVSGIVLRGDAPVAGLEVALASDDGRGTLETRRTDGEGRFAFERVVPGAYAVWGAYGRSGTTKVTVGADAPPAEVVIRLPQLRIAGRVVDDRTGEALPGAWVDCQVAGAAGGSNLTSIANSYRGGGPCGADGGFAFGGLAEGRYVLRAQREGYGTALVEAEAGIEGAEAVEIRLGPGGTLTGHVRNALGVPVEGAALWILDPAGRKLHFISLVSSSSDGSYTQSGLAPGTYDVRFEHEEFAPATQRVTIAGGDPVRADFTLLGGGRVEVFAMRAGGAPLEGAVVALIDAEGREVTRGVTLRNVFSLDMNRTDAGGRVTLVGVAAGRHTVRLRSGAQEVSRPVEVFEGGTTRVDVELPAPEGTDR